MTLSRFVFVFLFVMISVTMVGQTVDMPLLHARRGINAGVYDPQGRYILLRGANYNVLGEYWQGVKDVPPTKEYDDKDFELMAQNGFNCVRLLFTWSRLEPQRGHIDTAYISRIRHAVETAARYHIYVLLDMHQDAWGIYVASRDSEHCASPAKGWDGAPEWATMTDGQPTCGSRSRESAPAVVRAFSSFWDDRDSLQEECIKSWSALVSATARYTNVLGYDLINEPNLGERTLYREDRLIGKYYNKLIRSIREAEQAASAPQHIILFEPSVTWRGREIPSIPYTTFRPERNILFSPHHYFESLGDQLSIEGGFKIMRIGAFLYHTGMLIGEWGFFRGASDTTKVRRYAAQEDKYMIGSTWWQWSQACGDPHSVGWNGHEWQAGDRSMHLIELDRQGHFTGHVNEPILNILNRIHPLAVAGAKGFSSNSVTGEFHMKGHSRKASTVILWIPERFGSPRLTGKNASMTKTNTMPGGYYMEVSVKGKYRINFSPDSR